MMKVEEIGKLNIQIADGNYSAKYPRNDEFVNEGIPFIRANNFKNHEIVDDALLFITKEKHAILKKGHLKPGDVLITTRGNIGNTAIVPERHNDSNINAQIVLLRPDATINNKYLMLLFQSPDVIRQIEGLTTGTALKQLPVGQLKKVKIPIPPLSDQIRIAEILSSAENLIAQRKQSISLLDELLKSTFLEMFGDPSNNRKKFKTGKIRDIVAEVKYGTSKPAENNGQYSYLRMNNITTDGYMDFSNLKYINLEANEIEKYVVRKGDILFNRTNSKELVGKTGVFNESTEMAIAGYLIRIRTNEKANPWFIWGYLNSLHGKKTLFSMCKSIVGMANINAQELQEIKILIPPIELQSKFAAIVEKVEALKSQYQQSLTELQNMYGVLSQKAFKGELSLDKKIIKEKV